jgi:hypothetical protein
MDHVNVGMVAPTFVYFPILVAIERGFFGPRGIECGISVAGTTDGTTAALEKGETQFATVTPEWVISNAAKGGRLRLVEANSNRAPLSLIGRVGQHLQPCCDYTARLRKFQAFCGRTTNTSRRWSLMRTRHRARPDSTDRHSACSGPRGRGRG